MQNLWDLIIKHQIIRSKPVLIDDKYIQLSYEVREFGEDQRIKGSYVPMIHHVEIENSLNKDHMQRQRK